MLGLKNGASTHMHSTFHDHFSITIIIVIIIIYLTISTDEGKVSFCKLSRTDNSSDKKYMVTGSGRNSIIWDRVLGFWAEFIIMARPCN